MTAIPEAWRDEFLAALRFLTRLPVGAIRTETEPSLAAAAWAFPVVGIVIGLIGAIVYFIALALDLPLLAAALIALGATLLATGALHEDGLADCADGFGGGVTRDEKLAIMRDSRIGAYGVLALILCLGLRMSAIASVAEPWHVLGALVGAHALARGVLPAALRFLPPARDGGLGYEAGRPEPNAVLIAALIAVIVAIIGIGFVGGVAAAIAASLVAVAIGAIAQRQIGGQTGDVLGAIEQGAEIAALLAAAAAWS